MDLTRREKVHYSTLSREDPAWSEPPVFMRRRLMRRFPRCFFFRLECQYVGWLTLFFLKWEGLDGTHEMARTGTVGVWEGSNGTSGSGMVSSVDRPGSPKHQGRVGRDISRARSDGKLELKMERMLSTPQVVSSNRQKLQPRHSVVHACERERFKLANTGRALEVEGNC